MKKSNIFQRIKAGYELWSSLKCNDMMLTRLSQNSMASALFLVHVFPIHRAFYYLWQPTSRLQKLAVDLSAGHAGKLTDDTTLLVDTLGLSAGGGVLSESRQSGS